MNLSSKGIYIVYGYVLKGSSDISSDTAIM